MQLWHLDYTSPILVLYRALAVANTPNFTIDPLSTIHYSPIHLCLKIGFE